MNVNKLKGIKHTFSYMGERIAITIKPEFTASGYDEMVARSENTDQKSLAICESLSASLSGWDLEDNDGPIPIGNPDEDALEIYQRVPFILVAFINNELAEFVKRGGLGKKNAG
jgi:hypothetical protein